MRTEADMLEIILGVARSQETVRAVVLQGSRANPQVKKDRWQDFDVVYLVESMDALVGDQEWLTPFGERLIMQTPEGMTLFPPENQDTFAYLMLFTDGNRIDLTLVPMWKWEASRRGSLSILLLDKDGRFGTFPEPSEADYYIRPPTVETLADCCNEFWWTSTYVAKGLCRSQLPYAKAMLETVVRKMLDQMLRWYLYTTHGPEVNPGLHGKYFQQYLAPDLWRALLATYPDAVIGNIWKALFAMTTLFEQLSRKVADYFDLDLNMEEGRNVERHLRQLYRESGN